MNTITEKIRSIETLPQFDCSQVGRDFYPYNSNKIYLGYFQTIPNVEQFRGLEAENWKQQLKSAIESEIIHHTYVSSHSKSLSEETHVYILRGKILVKIKEEDAILCYQDPSAEMILQLKSLLQGFIPDTPDTTEVNLIISEEGQFENRKIQFKNEDLELEKLFNNGFQNFHQQILKHLSEEGESGLHLLYGKPGTGKSTYLRLLFSQVKKKVIFLPGQLAQNLDSTSMTKYLITNANSVLVIEDAEELIVSRQNQRNSNLAMILNLTDGILGESLGIQIIATFNTELRNIDPALLRKGRLKTSYEFKELTPEKTNALLREQGFETEAPQSMSLADIFNYKEESHQQPVQKAVGFKS